MMNCLPRVFRSALPWLPIAVAALLIPACIAPTGDDSDEPTAVTAQPLDSAVDGGQGDAANPNGTCSTPECLKLGGQ